MLGMASVCTDHNGPEEGDEEGTDDGEGVHGCYTAMQR